MGMLRAEAGVDGLTRRCWEEYPNLSRTNGLYSIVVVVQRQSRPIDMKNNNNICREIIWPAVWVFKRKCHAERQGEDRLPDTGQINVLDAESEEE
jgi:hypothetical protein